MERYRLGLRWNMLYAEYEYVLYRIFQSFVADEEVAHGDIEWATRTAKHYKIPLPDPKD